MLWLIVHSLLVGYVPGALILRLPGRSRAYRSALPADERVFWAVVISVAWSLAAVLVLAGLGIYSFDRLLALNAACSVAILVAFRARLSLGGAAHWPSWTATVPLAIAVIGLRLYFPPSEYVIGGRDPGTYVNEGVQIAQRGSIVIRDQVIASVPAPFRDLFFPSHEQRWYHSLRFMGFFIQDPDRGDVIGQFPHLFPASIAIGYGMNGLSGARQTVGVWAILGLLAVYFTGVRLFGRTAAAAAAVLLAIHVAQIWFARYPNTEVVMQALLFAALLAFAHALDGSQRFFGAVAAVLLGLMLFLRYDVVIAFATFAAAAVIAPVTRQRLGVTFGIVLAAMAAIGFWYLKVPMRAYSYYPLGFTGDQVGWWLLAGGLIAALAVHRLLKHPTIGAVVRHTLPPVLAVSLVGLAVYAYFFRTTGDRLAVADAMSLRTFAWYTGSWVLGAAVAGMAIAVARRFWRHPAFYLTFTAFSLFFFYKTRIMPEHFWAARRFLAITLPGVILALTALAATIAGPATMTRLLRASGARLTNAARTRIAGLTGAMVTIALLAPVGHQFWQQSEPIRHHVEYAGLVSRIERLAAQMGDDELLIVESRNASDLHVFAPPLAYIYKRNVLVLNTPAPPKRTFEAFLSWAESHYRGVLFLGGGGSDLLTSRIQAEPVAAEGFQVPEYDAPLDAYPSGIRHKEFEYGLYRLTTGEREQQEAVVLPVGGFDDLHVVRFHARERHNETGALFRWTSAQSFVVLTGAPASARTMTIWMSRGGRPPSAPEPSVEIAVGDRVLGTVVPTDEMAPYTLALPADAAALLGTEDPAWLRLRTNTWSPAALLGVPDSRDLGVMVTRVEVR